MARLLALEWNETEARLAVAGTRGDQYEVEHAFSVSLGPASTGEGPETVNAGERIAAALATRGLGRLDTLVAIGRTNIELRNLSFPPVPDAELPDMVRFQAAREFNALNDNWPLDFLPIDDEPDQPRRVLAAAVDPEFVGQIRETCRGAGLKPRRLILRPCAAASLLCRTGGDTLRGVTLLVDLLVDEADLTVVSDRKVIYLRTARLPGDPLVDASSSLALLSEIRRTTAAAQNLLGGRAVESIALCGSGEKHSELAAVIRRKFETPTELFDPFAGLTLSAELGLALPDHPGRFAPLLGALVDELEQAPHAIDFLHPRRPPRPPSRRNTYALVGLVAAALVGALLIGSLVYGRHLANETDDLNQRLKALDKQLQQALAVKSAAAEIENWRANDFNWLEELRWLSENLPPAKETMLTELQMLSRDGQDVGVMAIAGLAQDIRAIERGEENLRDDRHEVIGNRATEEKSTKSYAWQFSSSVLADKGEP